MVGLAQAFLTSGSRAVLAPTRPVRDDAARAFVARFYVALLGGARGSPSAAFREAAVTSLGEDAAARPEAAAGRTGSRAGSSQSFRLMVQ